MAKKKEETVETPVVETTVNDIEVTVEETEAVTERQDPGNTTRAYRG
jgi:hypothetical protein